jgi:hypothetical protein
VVVNNYRQNDYEPYLFHTTDFGRQWSRVVGASDVEGYVLSFAQDPRETRLQFLGTEQGLWVTIDGGENWTKWTVGFPTVPTMDMVIQPREQDLVIGTFGRSAFIIDDIEPLRALARDYKKVTSSNLSLFEPPVAYLADFKNAPGYYFSGDAYFEGENRPAGARISYYTGGDDTGEKDKKDTVTITVLDQQMNPVRTLKAVPEKGLNRTVWNLERKGERVNFSERQGGNRDREPGGGGTVLPGSYTLQLSFKGDTVTTSVSVKPDPRRAYDLEGMKLKQQKCDLLLKRLGDLNEALSTLRRCRARYELLNELAGDEVSDRFKESAASMKEELDRISKLVFRDESVQGIYSDPDALYMKMSGTYGITGADRPLTANQLKKLERYLSLADEAINMIDQFIDNQWKSFKTSVAAEQISLIE